jgi:hypothetical protein
VLSLLFVLQADRDAAKHQLASAEADVIDARNAVNILDVQIAGIKEGAMLASGNPVEPTDGPVRGSRKPRRDIRAMVKQWCETHQDPDSLFPHYIAKQLGCRESQVEAALKAIKNDVDTNRVFDRKDD